MCGSQAALVRWRILLQWGWKGPKAAAGWGPAKAGGAGADVPNTGLWFSQKFCLPMERDLLFLLQPLLQGLPRKLTQNRHTRLL